MMTCKNGDHNGVSSMDQNAKQLLEKKSKESWPYASEPSRRLLQALREEALQNEETKSIRSLQQPHGTTTR
jgi:hypothetical protein